MDVLHLVVEGFRVFMVDSFLFFNVCFDLRFELFSLIKGIVAVGKEIINDGFV